MEAPYAQEMFFTALLTTAFSQKERRIEGRRGKGRRGQERGGEGKSETQSRNSGEESKKTSQQSVLHIVAAQLISVDEIIPAWRTQAKLGVERVQKLKDEPQV